ncbi:MAG: PD-(D/E)XK nuclease family protein [Halofilum sp. (in: g-proteobacteria)]|nr:PD-(D/E)XK nuclease family protein [Halofilum sp. (in: g-proteobacteria)]
MARRARAHRAPPAARSARARRARRAAGAPGGGLRARPDADTLAAWRAEARAVLDDPALAELFDTARYERAWNEVAVTYGDAQGRLVTGVVDRLVKRGDETLVVDYKTHAQVSADEAEAVAAAYGAQLARYAAGVSRLWPGTRVRALVLFTAPRRCVELTPRLP